MDSLKSLWNSARFRWLVWFVYLVFWTVALLMPHPMDLVGFSMKSRKYLYFSSKLTHVAAYAFFAVLSGWVRAPSRYRWLLLLFLPLHAAGTEFLQGFVTRGPSWRDVILNLTGIFLGTLVSWKWWRQNRL